MRAILAATSIRTMIYSRLLHYLYNYELVKLSRSNSGRCLPAAHACSQKRAGALRAVLVGQQRQPADLSTSRNTTSRERATIDDRIRIPSIHLH